MSKQFINEVSRMKDLFDYKRGVVISEQKIIKEAFSFEKFPCINPEWEKTSGYFGSTAVQKFQGQGNDTDKYGNKLSEISFDELGNYYVRGAYVSKFSCSSNGRILLDGVEMKPSNSAPITKKATQWIKEPATLDDVQNTLKKQMTGEKVKQLQTGLDIKGRGGKSLATGKFWTLTDAKLKELYPNEYTTQKGVTKTLFDKIVNPTLKASTAPAPTTIPAAGATPAGTTQAAPAAGTPPTTVTAPQMPAVAAKQTPEEIYNTLKSKSLVQGDLGNNNIRIDAKALNDEQRNKLQEYMTSNGYDYRRTRNRDGRLVYTKR